MNDGMIQIRPRYYRPFTDDGVEPAEKSYRYVTRDYAARAMSLRDYNTVLLRDCTTGIETHETQRDMTCTRGAIATCEMTGTYSMTGDELIQALSGTSEHG